MEPMAMLIIVVFIVVYFIPSFIGSSKRNAGGIFVLNLLLGWTFLGWVIALVWACCRDEKKRGNESTRELKR